MCDSMVCVSLGSPADGDDWFTIEADSVLGATLHADVISQGDGLSVVLVVVCHVHAVPDSYRQKLCLL